MTDESTMWYCASPQMGYSDGEWRAICVLVFELKIGKTTRRVEKGLARQPHMA